MLENVPRSVGKALRGVRAGMDKIVYRADEMAGVPESISLTSPAFSHQGAMPARFTVDGAQISPPLEWRVLAHGAVSLVLLVEDPDAPSPEPFVHLIAWDIPAGDGKLDEGELKSPGREALMPHSLGRNSFMKAEYMPPDPPPGHGPHRYVFQLYALDCRLDLHGEPGRGRIVEEMRDHVLARGLLVGTYERK